MPIPRLEPAPGYVVIPMHTPEGKRRYILAQETGLASNGARIWREIGDYGEHGDAAKQSHTLYVQQKVQQQKEARHESTHLPG
jgi:hypothetical protein